MKEILVDVLIGLVENLVVDLVTGLLMARIALFPFAIVASLLLIILFLISLLKERQVSHK